MQLQEELRKHIKAISHPLKKGLELELALKAKLTKRELKLLKLWASSTDISEILNIMHFNEQEYTNLSQKLVKKINQEKVKQALYDI